MIATLDYTELSGRRAFVIVSQISHIVVDHESENESGSVIILNYCLMNDVAVRPQEIRCQESIDELQRRLEM